MKNRVIINFFMLGLGGILLLSSCSRQVARISENQVVDLSGGWNNTDSRMVSEAMTKDFLSSPWVDRYLKAHNKKPVVIVGFVINKSHEHIDAETFLQDIETAIINNGTVRLVQGGEKRTALRAERADQQENSAVSTIKKFGLEQGADFMLQGTITSIVDAFKRNKVVQYQISLQATNIETNEIVWMGTKKITKTVAN